MQNIKKILRPLAITIAFAAISGPALANYPNQPIRMIVGFPPGGVSDVVARAVANEASNVLGQSVIVENRPGAGTTIASDMVARAEPDGYTLLFQDLTTHAINASLYTNLSFDAIKDFTPVATVSSTPLLLVVNADSPSKTVADLTQRIQSNPDQFFYGSSGNGTIIHLASAMMNRAQGLKMEHVPYKGSAALVTSLMSGDIEYAFSSMPPAISQVQAGKLRPLAVTTPERIAIMADVPTMREANIPEAEVTLYSGILAPAGLPDEVLKTLNDAFRKVASNPQVVTTFEQMGATPRAATPEEVGELLEVETARYGEVIKAMDIQIN